MERESMECALELIWEQYQNMTDREDKWEWAFLQAEADQGIDALGAACRMLFGDGLEGVLYQALLQARDQNAQADDLSSKWEDEAEMEGAVLIASDVAGAVKLIHQIQRKQKCGLIAQSRDLVRSIARCAKGIEQEGKNFLD